LKMAKKRAQVDATLTVGSLSDIFTQDLEDMAQFEDRETMENMTPSDASNIKVTFGKYRGSTLEEIYAKDKGYIEWLAEKAKHEDMKNAARAMLGGQPVQQPAEAPQAPAEPIDLPPEGMDELLPF